jgi:hypothetical protein
MAETQDAPIRNGWAPVLPVSMIANRRSFAMLIDDLELEGEGKIILFNLYASPFFILFKHSLFIAFIHHSCSFFGKKEFCETKGL